MLRMRNDDSFAEGCAEATEKQAAILSCTPGRIMTKIDFASFGQPRGRCGSFAVNFACHSSVSRQVVEALCLQRNRCSVPATLTNFGDPCYTLTKRLKVQAHCHEEPLHLLRRKRHRGGEVQNRAHSHRASLSAAHKVDDRVSKHRCVDLMEQQHGKEYCASRSIFCDQLNFRNNCAKTCGVC